MSKREYNGDPLDMSWQTPPWKNDGETLDAYSSDGDNEITMETWPENATDPEELNEKQKTMIQTAAVHNSVDDAQELVRLSNLDVSKSYPNYVLKSHWPERYWGKTMNERIEKSARDPKEDVEELRRALLESSMSLNELTKYRAASREYLSRIVRGEVEGTAESDIPPLEWLNSSKRWINPEEYYDNPVEANYDDDNQATITEPLDKLRRRALRGDTAQQIADDHGVSGRTIRKRLKGQFGDESHCEVRPLEYDSGQGSWVLADEKAEKDSSNTIETEELDKQGIDETTTTDVQYTQPNQDKGNVWMTAWVWGVVGAILAWIASKVLR